MYSRLLNISEVLKQKSVFLFGPRQTGKTTYLKDALPQAMYLDLLDYEVYLPLMQDPASLKGITEKLIKQHKNDEHYQVIVIDEIQRIPELLNTVHLLIEKYKNVRFVLTGSSARKLRNQGINLLGGRAIRLNMHPLTSRELQISSNNTFGWKDLMRISALPSILLSANPLLELRAYADSYLRLEIEAESLVRRLPEFSRFLIAVANINGNQIVFEKIGARAGVSAKMAQSWFQILEDTMFGYLLPTFKEIIKREPVSSPKFYFFDLGLVRFLQGRRESDIFEEGIDLESFILQEIIAWRDLFAHEIEVSYLRTKSKVEIDFVLSSNSKVVFIEIKTSNCLTEHDYSSLKIIAEETQLNMRRILVNPHILSQVREDGIELFSVNDFLSSLWDNKIFNF